MSTTPPWAYPMTEPPCLLVDGGRARFAVRRIWCVGRNYADHAREMGADPDLHPPTFFAKPPDSLRPGDGPVAYPPATENLHHEVELVVALSAGGSEVAPERALDLVCGYAVGLDLTRRDLQAAAKEVGGPWELAKGFDDAAPCSGLRSPERCGHPARGRIEIEVNGETRQRGDLDCMIWPVPSIVAHLSRLISLAPGDLIFTGTPAGVGPLVRGDRTVSRIEGVGELRVDVV